MQSPASQASDPGERTWHLSKPLLRRMLAAGMLGAAVFLVQAGVAELVLRSDRICQETRASNRAFNPRGCQPESVRFLLQGLAHGAVGALRPDLPAALGVVTMAALMGVVAALLGFLPARRAMPAFLVLEALATAFFALVGFLSLYAG